MVLVYQPSNEGLDLSPDPLTENDIGIYIVNANTNGTEFQIEIKNELRQTIYYSNIFQYKYLIYNSTGDQIDTWLMDGIFQEAGGSNTLIECQPGATHALDEAINPDDYEAGNYTVSFEVYMLDYYDNVVVYESERAGFRV